MGNSSFENKLTAFFKEHKRSKLWKVEQIAETFKNNEEQVMEHLNARYNRAYVAPTRYVAPVEESVEEPMALDAAEEAEETAETVELEETVETEEEAVNDDADTSEEEEEENKD